MRNLVVILAITAILGSTLGCANGPLRRWMRGAPCNTCQPPIGQPLGENFIGGCNTGNCSTGTCNPGVSSTGTVGNGLLGGIFRGNHRQTAATVPPVSLPASSFPDAPPAVTGTQSTDFYGNTNSTGQLELPPISGPFN